MRDHRFDTKRFPKDELDSIWTHRIKPWRVRSGRWNLKPFAHFGRKRGKLTMMYRMQPRAKKITMFRSTWRTTNRK